MHDISLNPKIENVLILDYNTIRFQSVGFIKLMQNNGLESAKEHSLNSSADLLPLLNFEERNVANFIDGGISEFQYFEFIKRNFIEITDNSPITHLANTCSLMSMQQFVSNAYVATLYPVPLDIYIQNNFKPVVFDIFNIESIENFIIENNITSLFISDAAMVVDIVTNLRIKLEGFSFLISKLGCNLIDIGDALVSKYSELHELSKTLEFKFALVDLYNEFETMEDEDIENE